VFVKYVMVDNSDYRGHVKLVVRNAQSQEVAYSQVVELDDDMVVLSADEIRLVKKHSPGVWYDKREQHILAIDQLADSIRQSWLEVGTNTIDLEYRQVEQTLNEWQAAGSDPNDIPEDLLIWKDVTGQTLEWVVNDISTQIQGYKMVLSGIRRARLTGKKALRDAPDDQLEAVYANVLVQLESMRGSSNDPDI